MSATTPTFSYTCELCGLDGMSDESMRAHTVARHIRGRAECPFCDLSDAPPEQLLLHVNQAHLDYLTPEAELMAFIDDHSPIGGDDSDSKTLTNSYSYGTPNSFNNGWYTPETNGVISHQNGAFPKNLKNSLSHHNGYRNGQDMASHNKDGKDAKNLRSDKGHRDYEVNGIGSSFTNVNLNGVKSKSSLKKKIKSRQSSSEDDTAGNSVKSDYRLHSNSSGSEYEVSPAASKVSLSGAGQGSPLRSQLALKLKANTPKKSLPTPSPTIQCLMCQFTSTCPQKLEEHMNRAHFDLTSPSVISGPTQSTTNDTTTLTYMQTNKPMQDTASCSMFQCPICEREFTDGSEVELHVNIEHRDILSPQKDGFDNSTNANGIDEAMLVETPSPSTVCPVCCQTMPPLTSQRDLMEHIEEHFEKGHDDVNRVITEEEKQAQRHREQREFNILRAQYGMEEDESPGGGEENGLRRAVYSGRMSVSDYYERRVGLRRANAAGVDDASSCTQGLLSKIASSNLQNSLVVRTYLCSAVDHYASTYGDRGWGCGYRNTQMLISSLLQHTGYNELLYQGAWGTDSSHGPPRTAVPSITRLQLMVEHAWQMGFDIQGSEQLGCKLYNTRKWIGACEVVTVLSSLRIRCQLVDFHRPTSPDGGHPELFSWVQQYFQDNPHDFKPPLYLQHQGHSRTIIGLEKHRDGRSVLIVLDPSHSPMQVRQILQSGASCAAGVRGLRRGSSALRAKQYQLVTVTGLIDTQEEYEASKVLQSVRIPQDR